MSTNVLEGDTGSGKSYLAVNKIIADYLRDTRRVVYTNLPIYVDEFISSLSPNPVRQSDYRRRLMMVEERMAPVDDDIWRAWIRGALGPCKGDVPPGQYADAVPQALWLEWKRDVRERQAMGFVVLPDPNCEELIEDGRIRNTLKEFWWFLTPGSVVVVDESADLWNTLKRTERPGTLTTFFNHHRHYKLDIFALCQSRSDIDNQVRSKFNTVWIVTNSFTEKVGEHWLLAGMKWPVQFFTARQYAGRTVYGKGGDLRRYEPAGPALRVWARRAGFKTYKSHSQAGTLPGMASAAESAESNDVRTWRQQISGWVARLWVPVAWFGGMAVGAWVLWRALFGMMHATSGGFRIDGATNTVAALGPATNAVAVPGTATNQAVSAATTGEGKRIDDQPVFVSSAFALVGGRRFAVGDVVGGRSIRRILRYGVEWGDGQQSSWAVLLRGGQGRGDHGG